MALLFHLLFFALSVMLPVNAHMMLRYPPPAGNPNNSPVNNQRNVAASTGGEYPCKVANPADYANAPVTNLQLGGTLNVQFRGSAVHGGGSCQFSLTKDSAPTSNSVFKVIHSVEGGCPARDTAGNLSPSDPNLATPGSYPVPIPAELAPGRYFFSWTWINKLGNREFYMNCAAVQVGGTSTTASGTNATANSKRDASSQDHDLFVRAADPFFESLPNMVIINTSKDDCTNPEGVSYKYANPGRSVERNEDMSSVKAIFPQCIPGNKHILSADAVTPDDSSPGTGTGTFTSANATTTATSTTTTAAATGATKTGFSTVVTTSSTTSSSSGFAPTGFASGNPPSISGVNTGKGVDTSSINSLNPNGVCTASQKLCSVVGFTCVSDTEFVQCSHLGECAVRQTVAAGATCSDATIVARGDGQSNRNLHTTIPAAAERRRNSKHQYLSRHWHKRYHAIGDKHGH